MSRFTKVSVLSAALVLAACNAPAPTPEDAAQSESSAATSSESTDSMHSESSITFVGKSNIIDHQGTFETFTAVLTRDATTPADLTKATLAVTIDMDSVKSDPGVEGHMKREDFFDVAQFPQATFTTTSITAGSAEGEYVLNGDMTIKGVTKQVSIPAMIDGSMLMATYDLPRKDFAIGNDSYGDKFLEEFVPLEIHLILE